MRWIEHGEVEAGVRFSAGDRERFYGGRLRSAVAGYWQTEDGTEVPTLELTVVGVSDTGTEVETYLSLHFDTPDALVAFGQGFSAALEAIEAESDPGDDLDGEETCSVCGRPFGPDDDIAYLDDQDEPTEFGSDAEACHVDCLPRREEMIRRIFGLDETERQVREQPPATEDVDTVPPQ